MWTKHDYPRYGLVARCVHQGYTYGSNVTSCHSQELGKVVYEGSHCWLEETTHIKKIKIQLILMGKKDLEINHNQ